MSRMIDADALEELFREVIGGIAKKPEMNGNLEHMVRASAMVIEMIKDAPTIEERKTGRWIPCTERLPEEYGNYLVTTDDGDVDIGTIDTDRRKWSACDANGFFWLEGVTAWMPLPEPYREEAVHE